MEGRAMERLADISVPELQRALSNVDEKTAALRLVAAIAYKNDVSQTELAEWFGVERKTIYNWLTRLESADLERAVHDDHRPGRPRKLSEDQLRTLERALHDSPKVVGIDAPGWTVSLVQQFIHDEFDVSYSEPSCRRLMQELGLHHVPKRHAIAELDGIEPHILTAFTRNHGPIWAPR